MVIVVVPLMLLLVLTVMLVLTFVALFVVHLCYESISVDEIVTKAKIKRGETQVIGAKKAEGCLGGVNWRHEGFFSNNRNFLLSVVEYNPANTLTRAKI